MNISFNRVPGEISRRDFSLDSVRRLCLFFVTVVVVLSALRPLSVASASDTAINATSPAVGDYARQSLLFRIDADGLHLTRRDLLDGASSTQSASVAGRRDESTRSSVTRLDRDSQSASQSTLAADALRLQQSADAKAAIPFAEWLDADGITIAVTQFQEPRLARVPQQGQLIHEAVLGQSSAYFLLRGPAAAETVNVFLPDLAVTETHDLRGAANARTNSAVSANKIAAESSTEVLRQAAQQNSELQDVLRQQNWQVDLLQ